MRNKKLANIEWRLRRLEVSLKHRNKQWEIKPTKRFFQNFPRLREAIREGLCAAGESV